MPDRGTFQMDVQVSESRSELEEVKRAVLRSFNTSQSGLLALSLPTVRSKTGKSGGPASGILTGGGRADEVTIR
jgi:molybdopterin-guanine dinucleotide biosynthesis protein A